MTIITSDGYSMAADSASFRDGLMFPCRQPKIVRGPADCLVGATGASVDCYTLRLWVVRGMDWARPPQLTWTDPGDNHSILWLWLVGPGDLRMGDCRMNSHPVPLPTTIGFGAQFMTGLLAAGMPFADAVRQTIRRTAYLGGDMQLERVSPELSNAGRVLARHDDRNAIHSAAAD